MTAVWLDRGRHAGKTLSANQLEFINLVVDHLTDLGVQAHHPPPIPLLATHPP
jgi:2,3-bisphosphoglycerate-independent phosphoglycerate mutase